MVANVNESDEFTPEYGQSLAGVKHVIPAGFLREAARLKAI